MSEKKNISPQYLFYYNYFICGYKPLMIIFPLNYGWLWIEKIQCGILTGYEIC